MHPGQNDFAKETHTLDWWVPGVEVDNPWVRRGVMKVSLRTRPRVPVLRRIAQKLGAVTTNQKTR